MLIETNKKLLLIICQIVSVFQSSHSFIFNNSFFHAGLTYCLSFVNFFITVGYSMVSALITVTVHQSTLLRWVYSVERYVRDTSVWMQNKSLPFFCGCLSIYRPVKLLVMIQNSKYNFVARLIQRGDFAV